MKEYLIKQKRKKLYVYYTLKWQDDKVLTPLLTDDINFAIVVNEKDGQSIIKKSNFKNLELVEVKK